MFRLFLLTLCCVVASFATAQRQFPVLPVNIDSLLDRAADPNTSREDAIRLIRKIDTIAAVYESAYPLYRGVLYMYQAFDSRLNEDRTVYQAQAKRLIEQNPKHLADSFSAQLLQLAEFYKNNKRLQEWMPIDSLLRKSVAVGGTSPDFVLLGYIYRKIERGDYRVVGNLSSYELVLTPYARDSSLNEEYRAFAFQWAKQKSVFERWKATPYYKRDEALSFKKNYEELIRKIGWLKKPMVLQNGYGTSSLNAANRQNYFQLYLQMLTDLAYWSIDDHREGVAILPLRQFLFEELLPNEFNQAYTYGKKPVVNAAQLRECYRTLARLYLNIGNGAEAFEVLMQGLKYFEENKNFTSNEKSQAFYSLYYMIPEARKIEGKFEASLKAIQRLKQFYPRPDLTDSSSIPYWNLYIDTRIQEAMLLSEHQNINAGRDSLAVLAASLGPADSSGILYNLYQWPQLQYVSMKLMGKSIEPETVRSMLLDALTTVEQANHWENVPYYYPMQLLYFIAHYRSQQKILSHVLHNLLFYTERNLRYSFIMISPEDRMRLYQQRLSDIFDVYHELLFNGELDKLPEIKEQVIRQSLFLKNALADNNQIPNQVFKTDAEMLELVEQIRQSKMDTRILTAHSELAGREAGGRDIGNASQALWLRVLSYVNTDSLYAAYDWKKIAARLTPKQVYVETVRYSNWLSDSSVSYGAYVISNKDAVKIVPLFKEAGMSKLLADPTASPQTGQLNVAGTRGLSIKGKKETTKKFRKGDKDRLGEYILSPLWAHIAGKPELLFVPDGLLNRVSMSALQWKQKDLFNYFLLRQLSGSNVLFQPRAELKKSSRALLAGGLDYGSYDKKNEALSLFNERLDWNYLPGTRSEIEKLRPMFTSAGLLPDVITGNQFSDSLRKSLPAYQLVHLASHGFYFDSSVVKDIYSRYVFKEAVRNDPLMRCGIAISKANNPDTLRSGEYDGYLLGFELANTDLRNCYLVSLSACETALGDLKNNLGVDGLSRALKLGGARHLLISLWKVPDAPTAVFMQQFYAHLFSGSTPAESLRKTQQKMSLQYPASDWAAFILVE